MSSANLTSALRDVDGTAPGIQRAASAMMKLYDTNAAMGVTSWRNILQSCRVDQLLPLVYVANEVLQISKRNRGNKFLEAFSGHLGQAVVFIASRFHETNPASAIDNVEKLRRVIKIWGDRQVFSIRYVSELLTGLEPYRRSSSNVKKKADPVKKAPPAAKPVVPKPPPPTFEDEDGARFSPLAGLPPPPSNFPDTEPSPATGSKSTTAEDNTKDDDDDDIMNILDERDKKRRFGSGGNEPDKKQSTDNQDNNDDDDDDDDDDDENDIFGDNDDDDGSQRSDSLKIEIDVNEVARRGSLASQNSLTKRNAKRRKSTTGATSESDPTGPVIKSSISHFVDLFHRLIQLKQQSDLAQVSLKRIRAKLSTAANSGGNDDSTSNNAIVSNDQLENLVGDELVQAKKQNDTDIATLIEQRNVLYKTAMEQYTIEQMIIQQYLPWFEVLLQQDTSDIQFCKGLEDLLQRFRPIHYQIAVAHQQRMEEITAKKRKLEELERIRREREENDRFRKAALAKETEAKPGMVWNPSTREYQALNTDESWRD